MLFSSLATLKDLTKKGMKGNKNVAERPVEISRTAAIRIGCYFQLKEHSKEQIFAFLATVWA